MAHAGAAEVPRLAWGSCVLPPCSFPGTLEMGEGTCVIETHPRVRATAKRLTER